MSSPPTLLKYIKQLRWSSFPRCLDWPIAQDGVCSAISTPAQPPMDHFIYWCANKWRSPKWEQTEATYSEFAISRESVIIFCVWEGLKGRQGSGKALQWKKQGKASGKLSLETGRGKQKMSYQEAGHRVWLVWRAYLALIGPDVEVEAKTEKLAVTHQTILNQLLQGDWLLKEKI